MSEQGNLYVISAPSGTGKTTLVKALVESVHGLTVSISHTTRQKRPAELDGVNYYFVDKTTFQDMIDHDDFLEHALVFSNYYGTSKRWVQDTLAKGLDVILEIDWQGGLQIQKIFPDCTSIFILPPSIQDLYQRLIHRNQDNDDIIRQRISDVRESTKHVRDYDYLVMNDDFKTALTDLQILIQAGRLSQQRQVIRHAQVLEQLAEAKMDTREQ